MLEREVSRLSYLTTKTDSENRRGGTGRGRLYGKESLTVKPHCLDGFKWSYTGSLIMTTRLGDPQQDQKNTVVQILCVKVCVCRVAVTALFGI